MLHGAALLLWHHQALRKDAKGGRPDHPFWEHQPVLAFARLLTQHRTGCLGSSQVPHLVHQDLHGVAIVDPT